MRNSEEAVARVLAGLRDVEAPQGMERRLVLAIQRRAEEVEQTGWRSVWFPVRRSSVAVRTLAAGTAFAGLLAAVLWMPKPRRSGTVPVVSQGVERPNVATVISAPELPTRMAARTQRAGEVRLRATDSSDALALVEMRAPSQPAPPLPLTEQEKLLLRVVRRHDPEQVAMLNPDVRRKQDLQAKVEFQEFFEPTPPIEEKRHTDSTDKKGDTR